MLQATSHAPVSPPAHFTIVAAKVDVAIVIVATAPDHHPPDLASYLACDIVVVHG